VWNGHDSSLIGLTPDGSVGESPPKVLVDAERVQRPDLDHRVPLRERRHRPVSLWRVPAGNFYYDALM
jgi:hypothetical protein